MSEQSPEQPQVDQPADSTPEGLPADPNAVHNDHPVEQPAAEANAANQPTPGVSVAEDGTLTQLAQDISLGEEVVNAAMELGHRADDIWELIRHLASHGISFTKSAQA